MTVRKRTPIDELYDQIAFSVNNRRDGMLIVHEVADDAHMVVWVDEDGVSSQIGACSHLCDETTLDDEIDTAIRVGRVSADRVYNIQNEAAELAAKDWKNELWRVKLPWGGWVWRNRLTARDELRELKQRANIKISESLDRVRDAIKKKEEAKKK